MHAPTEVPLLPSDTRERIIAAAAGLIATRGGGSATTRAVAAAAAVQAPTIYRLFGDKDGLLNAVAEDLFAKYVERKVGAGATTDAVTDLRQAWDTHIAFGMDHPTIFALISYRGSGPPSSAAAAGMAVLRERVRRVAMDGRLRVTEERAVDLIHASGTGTVLTLLEKPPEHREGLADAAREAVFAAVLTNQPSFSDEGPAGAASALRARLDNLAPLSPGERLLLSELLSRIAQSS